MPIARIVFFAATVAGLLLTARALLIEPPPLPLAALAVASYLAILLSGVFVLRLRMFADVVVRGPEGARGVALTFDDGPDPVHTREVLDVLDERGAKATFFVIGRKAERHPDLVREIVSRGHQVGLHGYAHDRLFSLRAATRVRADLTRARAVIEKITGVTPTIFRPPIGHTNPTIARVVETMSLTMVGWSVGARDGLARTKPADVLARVRSGLVDGAIVLLHDASERGTHKPAGVTALREILASLDEKNLRVTPLAAWLDRPGESSQGPGEEGSSTTKRAPLV